jgi:hypothetical protein
MCWLWTEKSLPHEGPFCLFLGKWSGYESKLGAKTCAGAVLKMDTFRVHWIFNLDPCASVPSIVVPCIPILASKLTLFCNRTAEFQSSDAKLPQPQIKANSYSATGRGVACTREIKIACTRERLWKVDRMYTRPRSQLHANRKRLCLLVKSNENRDLWYMWSLYLQPCVEVGGSRLSARPRSQLHAKSKRL